eukprot:g3691.t1
MSEPRWAPFLQGGDAFEVRQYGSFPVICHKSEKQQEDDAAAKKKAAEAKAKADAAKKAAEAKAAAAADDDDDDDDELFGDDDDLFDEEADAAAEARIAAAAAAHNAKKEAERIAKGKAVARSKLSYQFEVKPLEAGQDMEGLAQNIKKLSHDGIVTWGEQHKIVDVAFGIQKVLVQVIIYEDACCEDDLVDLITENFEDEVQSVDLIAMTKL